MTNEPDIEQVVHDLHELFALEERAKQLLDIIAAEFRTDPKSTQCFDQRIVQEVIAVSAKLRK